MLQVSGISAHICDPNGAYIETNPFISVGVKINCKYIKAKSIIMRVG